MAIPERIVQLPKLPPRPEDAHKGTFGTVLVVAGGPGMSGAAALCGMAALRGGAGLVRLAVPDAVLPLVAAHSPCYMASPLSAWRELAAQASAIVAGPGLGQSEEVRRLVRDLCATGETPLLLDADALNVLGDSAWGSRPAVVTPHPGEFKRLLGRELADREEDAAQFASERRCVVLLKGAGTVVTDGARLYVNGTGNPGMATGGTGDVLAGLIGALLAQGMPAFEAAVLGAHLHGLAGDIAAEHLGHRLIATDLLGSLPAAMRQHG
ncbi:MAG: NAD(P)H-hydrate dehydratase [Gemmataceae bacterium]|nr:NAD(P)H-hydrate dehydratase [Gemmataceae bacterium]